MLRRHAFIICISLAGITGRAYADPAPPSDPEFDELLSMDITDLNVTSVAKKSQRLTDTAAAIYVITQEDIRRSGVTNIPDALRMAPGIDVAKVGSNRWAISSRGFNSTTSNQLLVMIDGRSIYTPVFSGTYWDDQSTLIEDIDRIEVIRGPGAAIWGANAVSGVINIITKPAAETQGNLVSVTTNLTGGLTEVRHGGQIDQNSYYRIYGTYLNAGTTQNPTGSSNHDDWFRGRGGFRWDGKLSSGDTYTVQGDAYGGKEGDETVLPLPVAPFSALSITDDRSYGANVLGRWTHEVDKDSEVSVQAYLDHYSRLEAVADQHVNTADIEVHNNIRLDDRNNFIWGGGARLYVEELDGSFEASVHDRYANHDILNLFLQDEYALIPNKLYLTAGTKIEHNDYTGVEFEPSIRAAYHLNETQMVWGAISRAVRLPSNIDDDVNIVARVTPGAPPNELRVIGNPNQTSEEVIAYELGHRIQATRALSFDTALYYNDFSNLRTVSDPGALFIGADGNLVTPLTLNNFGSGHVYGAELSSNWNVNSVWRLSGSYTYSVMGLNSPAGTLGAASANALQPRHQFSLRSYLNLTENVHWDNMVYFVDGLREPVNQYVRYDTRLSYLVQPGIELSLIGRNLLDHYHEEFPSTPQAEIGRSLVGQVLWKF